MSEVRKTMHNPSPHDRRKHSDLPSVLVRNNVLPDAIFLCPTHHTDVLLVLKVVLSVLSGPTGRFKVQLECQGLLRYYG